MIFFVDPGQETLLVRNFTRPGQHLSGYDPHHSGFWISGSNGSHKCIMTKVTMAIFNHFGADLNNLTFTGIDASAKPWAFDIRAFNQKGFRITVGGPVGDEKVSLKSSKGAVMERLQNAWGLAFQECPPKKSDF